MPQAQTATIDFTSSENKSASELGGAMPTMVNAIPDAAGVVRRRPGISTWNTFPSGGASGSPVIGMLAFGEQLVYVTEDRKIHALSTAGDITELSSASDPTTLLDGNARPSLISGREMFVVAGGGAIQKWTGSGLSARLQNTGVGGPPPDSVFLCAIAQRLVAQIAGESGQIWWTGPLEAYENWDMSTGGASYIQAAAKPDPLVAMWDNTNEVFGFGSETIQVFAPAALALDENDPNNLLDFAPSRTMNIGTVSPYAVTPMDDMFAMLDRQRRCLITDGRTYNDVSKPIAQVLRSMQSVSDAWAFRMRFGRFDCIVWMFPTDGFGLMFDTVASKWCEWRAWGTAPKPVSITSAYNWAEQDVFLVGLSDGSIAQLDDSSSTDLSDPITVEMVSGFTNHGTSAQKHCRTLMLQFKRTWSDSSAPPYGESPSGHVRISYRDNQGTWNILRDVKLSDDPNPAVLIRSVGVYRTRQWKVDYTGTDEIQIVSAQEEFEVLGV